MGIILRAKAVIENINMRKQMEKKVFYYAKNFLKAGIYIVPFNRNEIISLRKAPFQIRNVFHIYINFSKNQFNEIIERDTDYIEFDYGSGKFVIFTDNFAYGFYMRNNLYIYAKNNYTKYYDKFNYPHICIFSFVDALKCIIMQRGFGVKYKDLNHDKMIVKSLLEFSTTALVKVNSFGKVYFLQHGDAKRANVLWQENLFIFLDLDGLHFLPPLFDVFHYLCGAGYGLQEIVSFLEEHYNLINTLCLRAKINDSNIFDNLFYEYVTYYINEIGSYYSDFGFLTIDNTKDYPKTNHLLKSIFNY